MSVAHTVLVVNERDMSYSRRYQGTYLPVVTDRITFVLRFAH